MGDPLSITVEAGKSLLQLVEQLDLIDSIKQKLVKQPDVAADKLSAVLEELRKSLLVLDTEVTRFLSIVLEPGPELRNDRAALYELEGPALAARLGGARARCGKIRHIYDSYLNPWFQRVASLDKTEREQLQVLFERLSQSDGEMVRMLDNAADWLCEKARDVLDLYEKGQLSEANQVIAECRREIQPVRDGLRRTTRRLDKFEESWVSMSGVA